MAERIDSESKHCRVASDGQADTKVLNIAFAHPAGPECTPGEFDLVGVANDQ